MDNLTWPQTPAQAEVVRRNWAIWRAYSLGGITYREIGLDCGITGSRVRQIIEHRKRKLKAVLNPGINVQWDNVADHVREATLGVEFVFRNELTLEDTKGWEQLEPTVYGSPYAPPRADWREEWGHQDTSPAKPVPAYTFYKTLTRKEQTND